MHNADLVMLGASIIAMIMLLLSIVGCVLARFEFEYAVVIETTATDTLGNCYSWPRRNLTTDPISAITILGSASEPIEYFAVSGGLHGINVQFQPLIQYCLTQVPVESQPYTPIYVLLGAAVRALTQPQRNNVLVVAGQAIRLSGFNVTNSSVVTLTPQTEQAFAYVGANYILGNGAGAALDTIAVEQTDIEFAMPAGSSGHVDATAVFLDGTTTQLTVPTYTLTLAQTALQATLRATPLSATVLAGNWSCFPTGLTRSVTVVRVDYRSSQFAVTGTSNASDCYAQLTAAAQAAANTLAPPTLPKGSYIGVGTIDGILVRFPQTNDELTIADLRALANTICAMSLAQLQAAFPDALAAELGDLCGEAMWVVVGLETLHITADTTIVHQSFGARVGAATGYVIANAASWPSECAERCALCVTGHVVGAPVRGPQCETVNVPLYTTQTLPPVIIYQCDCVNFTNDDEWAVHYIASSAVLNAAMPTFASQVSGAFVHACAVYDPGVL
jgi:hypothetical protein